MKKFLKLLSIQFLLVIILYLITSSWIASIVLSVALIGISVVTFW